MLERQICPLSAKIPAIDFFSANLTGFPSETENLKSTAFSGFSGIQISSIAQYAIIDFSVIKAKIWGPQNLFGYILYKGKCL